MVIDLSDLDADADCEGLSVVASVASAADPSAELLAEASLRGRGATWRDTTNSRVWVRTHDGRPPDSNIIVLRTGTNGRIQSTNPQSVWLKNIHFVGGTAWDGSGNTHTVRMSECSAVGSGGNAMLHGSGSNVILERCRGKYAYNDGFNISSSNVMDIDCHVNRIGEDRGATSNASTLHGTGKVKIVGGNYRTGGRVIADINSGERWMLGTGFGPSSLTSGSSNSVGMYQSDTTKAFLDACALADGSVTDLFCGASAYIYYANMSIAGFVLGGTAGNIQAYTP
jgi:hypothetical protein